MNTVERLRQLLQDLCAEKIFGTRNPTCEDDLQTAKTAAGEVLGMMREFLRESEPKRTLALMPWQEQEILARNFINNLKKEALMNGKAKLYLSIRDAVTERLFGVKYDSLCDSDKNAVDARSREVRDAIPTMANHVFGHPAEQLNDSELNGLVERLLRNDKRRTPIQHKPQVTDDDHDAHNPMIDGTCRCDD